MAAIAFCALFAVPADAGGKKTSPIWVADAALEAAGTDALRTGDATGAIASLSELVARNPRDGARQALLALAYHIAARERPEAADLALTGYDLALKSEPGQMWPAALAGRLAFDRGRYDEAVEQFAHAAMLRPDSANVLGALAAAAYMAGDIALAGLAADRAAVLAGDDPALRRIAATAAAASGARGDARTHLAVLSRIAPDIAAAADRRVAQIEASEPLDRAIAQEPTVPEPVEAPSQVSVDIAIVLSQNTHRERSGINLLDGLSLQYGTNRASTRTIRQTDGSPAGNDYQRVLTSAIGIPQLTYSLNLFNRGGQYYSVVARPQLTAFRGEQSEFFVGRTLKVAVNGIQSGSLEQIDIGIEMKVTPVEITATGTRVKIEAGRSFLTSDAAGSFSEALTTFRQKVVATAEVRFGETLLLSGLNETVDDATFSKTPVLGDVPLVGNLFNQRNLNQRRDSVIILVTPSLPAALPGRAFARREHAARLAQLWTTLIDPKSDAAATQARLSRMRLFTRMTRGDVTMPFPDAGQAAGDMLRDLLMPGAR